MTDATYCMKSDLKEFYVKGYDAGARDFEGAVHRYATMLAESLHSKDQQEAIIAFRDVVRDKLAGVWLEAQTQVLNEI